MKRHLKNPLIQTLCVVVFATFFAESMPMHMARLFYTFSTLLKDMLLLFLPCAVCVFIASTLLHFDKKGGILELVLMLFELCSNTAASLAAYGVSFVGAPFYQGVSLAPTADSLTALFALPKGPVWWRVEYATALGVILGVVLPFALGLSGPCAKIASRLTVGIQRGKKVAIFIFSRIFARLIPLFVLGFFINLVRTADFIPLMTQGGQAGLVMVMGLALYIGFLFFLSAGCSLPKAWQHFKNAAPAGLTALSSMSSAATMPVTIQAASKNLKNPSFAEMVIPATTNIQQIGDCFINIFLCCVMLAFFGSGIPAPAVFFTFLTVFVVARFTTSAVVGGAIFIMLPLYQTYLDFTPEMVSIILTFNMILDPLVTSSNVVANVSLCALFERAWNRIVKILDARSAPSHNKVR